MPRLSSLSKTPQVSSKNAFENLIIPRYDPPTSKKKSKKKDDQEQDGRVKKKIKTKESRAEEKADTTSNKSVDGSFENEVEAPHTSKAVEASVNENNMPNPNDYGWLTDKTKTVGINLLLRDIFSSKATPPSTQNNSLETSEPTNLDDTNQSIPSGFNELSQEKERWAMSLFTKSKPKEINTKESETKESEIKESEAEIVNDGINGKDFVSSNKQIVDLLAPPSLMDYINPLFRNQTDDEIYEEWVHNRSDLTISYKKQHKLALRMAKKSTKRSKKY